MKLLIQIAIAIVVILVGIKVLGWVLGPGLGLILLGLAGYGVYQLGKSSERKKINR